MNVNVSRIRIPAWSTIGYGIGTTEEGEEVAFVGDHRPMRQIGEMMAVGAEVTVVIEEHQLIPIELAENAD